MTTVTVTPHEIVIDGHANYGPEGQDIVCAAISTLSQALIRSIEDLTDDIIEYDIRPGRVDIKMKDLSDQGRLLIDSFFIGICQVATAYPDYLQVK